MHNGFWIRGEACMEWSLLPTGIWRPRLKWTRKQPKDPDPKLRQPQEELLVVTFAYKGHQTLPWVGPSAVPPLATQLGVPVAADHCLGPCCSGASSIKKAFLSLEQRNAPFPFKNHHVSSLEMAEEICIKYTLTGPLGITLKTGTSPLHLLAIKGTWRVCCFVVVVFFFLHWGVRFS